MSDLPRVYGDPTRYKVTLRRHIARGRDLLDRLEGLRRVIEARDYPSTSLMAYLHEAEWTDDVERWRGTVGRAVHRHLADKADALLPTLTSAWPPATGKPRHARRIGWVEPWLHEALQELESLLEQLGISRNVASVSPPSAQFAELIASGLVDRQVIDACAKDMQNPRTPKQLADAIGAAKELTEATLRAALDRLGQQWSPRDDMNQLMKSWRRRVDAIAAPDPSTHKTLDNALAALGNVVTFVAAWRNAYGRGHGRARYPSGLRPRHARLAVDGAETAIRFIVTTMDDMAVLPLTDAKASTARGGKRRPRST